MNYAMRFWDLNFFLFSLFFLFLPNLFSVFSLLCSGDIGAVTRSKSALVLTGHFAGRMYQLVLSSTPWMADSDVLSTVKALQDRLRVFWVLHRPRRLLLRWVLEVMS